MKKYIELHTNVWYTQGAEEVVVLKEAALMAAKRRDNKGRVLKEGEFQRADGRYEYRYLDAHSNRKSVYSWRLTESDNVPAG